MTHDERAVREALEYCRDELRWCSGAPCFNEDGEARRGWLNGPAKALHIADAALADGERGNG